MPSNTNVCQPPPVAASSIVSCCTAHKVDYKEVTVTVNEETLTKVEVELLIPVRRGILDKYSLLEEHQLPYTVLPRSMIPGCLTLLTVPVQVQDEA